MKINPIIITDHSDNENPIINKRKVIQKYEIKIAKLCALSSLKQLHSH